LKLVENDLLETPGRKRAETGGRRRITLTGTGGRRVGKMASGFLNLVAMLQMGVYYSLETIEQIPYSISQTIE